MNCIICKEEVGLASVNIGGHKVHLHCFFDSSIPEPAPQTDVNSADKQKMRNEAIEKRVKYINELIAGTIQDNY